MPTLITAARSAFIILIQRSFGITLSLLFLLGGAQAQTTPTDGTTPLALSPGTPAGSYALSGFDNVNLYNGHLNFSLPLLQIGGRGGAQMTMTLPIESAWQIQEVPIPQPGGGVKIIYLAVPNLWEGIKPGYGPGVLQGRRAGWGDFTCPDGSTLFFETLTRLTFTAPDGTEYEMRDQNSNGQPAHPGCSVPASRGQVFVTADGTAATFISDTIIQDGLFSPEGEPIIYPSGYLMMRDGTRYRIDNGVVSWLRDRNGNKMTFTYDAFSRVTSITDSFNRQVTVCYAYTAACGNTSYDLITFHGFAGAQRTIRVWYANLGDSLRTTQPGDVGTLQTVSQLFPPFPTLSNGTQIFNPRIVTSVELPNNQTYQFRYNVYGELARVALPTGGAFEYDYTGGVVGDAASGMMSLGGHAQIYRRVVTRRVYLDGTTGSLAEMMTYSRPESLLGEDLDYVAVDHYKTDGVTRLAQERHYYHGKATDSFTLLPTQYSPWKHGRERQTEALDADGATVLRRTINTWQQRPAATWFDPSNSQYESHSICRR